jgi:ribonuclease HI
MKSNKTKATNADLWEKLLVLVEKHDVTFHWVK